MPKFNTNLFLEKSGRGDNPITSLQTAFGMPSCMINLTQRILRMLPSPVLRSVRSSASNGANRSDDVIKSALTSLRFLYGVVDFETEDGTVTYVSESSENGIDKNDSSLYGSLSEFLSVLGAAAGAAGSIYRNYVAIQGDINQVEDCLKGYKAYLELTSNGQDEEAAFVSRMSEEEYKKYLLSQYGINLNDVRDAIVFRDKAYELVDEIDAILAARANDPGLEPLISNEYDYLVSTLNVEPPGPPQPEEVFRLTYGPPRSKTGQFLLSVDGLYFDSQTSGLIPALMEIESRAEQLDPTTKWKLEHDPNLGGKGKQMSLDDFKLYVNTILDPNIVDDSDYIKPYYNADQTLKDLIGQKNRRVYDLSAQVDYLTTSGASQILIANMRQVMLSETSHYLDKINKRKKQIELAIKLPSMYGKPVQYQPGKVPVNDFSYLEGVNYILDIESQKKMVLNQQDVSSVVLPLQTKFVKQIEVKDTAGLDHLLITNLGIGSVITNSVSATSGSILPIQDQVITDGLIVLYNYLNFEIENPSSTKYTLFNSAKNKQALAGQLISTNATETFEHGVGVPYFNGVVDFRTTASNIGSFAKLPEHPEIQDLLYNPEGATIETWVHVPGVLDSSSYNILDELADEHQCLYRLILGCENTGKMANARTYDSILTLPYDNGGQFTHGLVMGFTRDRRICSDALPSTVDSDNPASAACFFIAPTQSFDSSTIGFISRSFDSNENCYTNAGWYNLKVPVKTTVLSGVANGMCHLAVSFKPYENSISVYLDGSLLATSSYESVFGNYYSQKKNLNFPTPKKDNSFQYSAGPFLGSYFTPYVLGGGWSDGLPGGFMGTQYGGVSSGLQGHLGGTKLYNRCLEQAEILTNYRANLDFFKNVDLT